MNFDTLFAKYGKASDKSDLTTRDLINSIDHLCDYPDECAPWLSTLYTPDEMDYLMDYLSQEYGD